MFQDAVGIDSVHTTARVFASGHLRLRGDRDTARRHREWLEFLQQRLGMKLSPIAKAANVHPSTLRRPLSPSDDGTSTLNAETIAKVVATFQVPPPAGSSARPEDLRVEGSEGELLDLTKAGKEIAAVARAIARGGNCEFWRLWTDIEGDCLLAGDIVAVALDRQPSPNDLVLGETRDRERVIHVFRAYAPPYLLARSSRGALIKPLYVDNVGVKVRGVVTASARLLNP